MSARQKQVQYGMPQLRSFSIDPWIALHHITSTPESRQRPSSEIPITPHAHWTAIACIEFRGCHKFKFGLLDKR